MVQPNGPVTVCVINLKGGVGKSTISALLARHAYQAFKLDVLAVDLDPQANLSQAFLNAGYNDFLAQKRPSIVEVFSGYQPPQMGSSSAGPLQPGDVVVDVFQTDSRSLQVLPSRFDFSDNLVNSVKPDERVLAKFLSQHYRHKDLVIIDCAPTESVLTRAAYHASGLVLVPVKPEYFATIGFPLLQQSLTTFRSQNRGHHIDVAGVVINNGFYHGGNDGGPEKERAIREIRDEARKNSWTVFKNQIPFSRGFPKIMRGDHSYSGNAAAFPHFANEFMKAIGF